MAHSESRSLKRKGTVMPDNDIPYGLPEAQFLQTEERGSGLGGYPTRN